MAKLKTIAFAVTGISAFSMASLGQAATPNQTGMAMMRLNASLLETGNTTQFAGGSLWNALRKDFRMAEVNPELVRRHENSFVRNSAYFDRTINRSKPYMYHIANEVKKRNMPSEIALLPFIESAFVTKARSHVGASGLWQFMPATGRHYGLERTALYDGRHDVYAATDAALTYLQYLHGLFGDWSLALAAYNWGEGNVGRAVNRARAQGLEPTYENLRMPNETRNYVPKLLAVRNLVSNPEGFGLNLSDIDNKPHFKAVSIDQPIDNAAIARLAGISESEFLALNPGFNVPVFVPKANRKLLLPVKAAGNFEKNLRKANPDTLLSWDVYTAYGNTSLSSIAAETGMSVADIKRLNSMSGNSISSGRSILVAKNSLNNGANKAYTNFAGLDTDNTPDTYISDVPAIQTVAATPRPVVQNIAVASQQPAQADFTRRTAAPVTIAAAPPVQINSSTTTTASAMPKRVSTSQSAVNVNNTNTTTAVALNEPLPLPTQQPLNEPAADNLASAAPEAFTLSEQEDPLLALAQASSMRVNAADAVRNAVAEVEAREAAERARAAQLAEARAKQQQRTEARLARANSQPQNTGTHQVAAGDTLYSISQRYNLSVADLVTANNIKGNNIRVGQTLKVTAVAQRNAAVRNVSYTVRKGDTLNTIANRFNVDVNDIRRWNRNTRTITPGQRLTLIGS
ncbi:murein transglycosylase [Neisseria arctica]|uniref:Murein transglycosylase n=1 Tax=Neisseria arctica TaxID=1470200 RepID=A0A0J0YT76_9NEIS|nr:LysM peptidoglycan-binding domain-containing protein [Neisseria arctica]KLT73329.1 murein transglycosylase [Neisseria arctica]UOO87408.1 LysM peptidoglycan-binding domain-containing protein [Neisseria arctica]